MSRDRLSAPDRDADLSRRLSVKGGREAVRGLYSPPRESTRPGSSGDRAFGDLKASRVNRWRVRDRQEA